LRTFALPGARAADSINRGVSLTGSSRHGAAAMLRSLTAMCLLLVFGLALLAAEYKGKVKSVDRDKNTITITIDDKDKTFNVSDEVKVTRGEKEIKKKLKSKSFDSNPPVTLTTEGEGEKEVVKEIKIEKKDKQ
jgi:hypothetical protein